MAATRTALTYIMKCIPWMESEGANHISPACPLCWTQNLRKEQDFFWLNFGWSALLSDRPVCFYCPVLGLLREKFPRPVMLEHQCFHKPYLTMTSACSLCFLANTMLLLLLILWKAEPWGHPGRLPCTSQIRQLRPACTHMNTQLSFPYVKNTYIMALYARLPVQ